jgi:hypothetical protein
VTESADELAQDLPRVGVVINDENDFAPGQ